MFFCDPFGHTQKENLFNFGDDDIKETAFVYFHDQEPLQLEAYRGLFAHVITSNTDLYGEIFSPSNTIKPTAWEVARHINSNQNHIVVSEKGENLQKLVNTYHWKPHYYFFHGWACLDWFRGYNRTFLIPAPRERANPVKSFMCPNRIIGGERDHRTLFMYHALRNRISNAFMSCPRVCPDENIEIETIAHKYQHRYPDIQEVLAQAELPWTLPNETESVMSSCWLTNFDEANSSLVYVPTETVYFGKRLHLTEKTFKAIALGMPFILVAAAGNLEYLRSYGFQTFGDVWDEGYDQEQDDFERMKKIGQLLQGIDQCSPKELAQLQKACLPAVEHNWNHFYHGGFEKILWAELENMLNGIRL